MVPLPPPQKGYSFRAGSCEATVGVREKGVL